MQGQDNSEHGESIELTDAWWAKRAKRLLHPIQVEIIEIFQRADQPLTVRDLSKVFDYIEPVNLDYHVGRLRSLGALELTGRSAGAGFMDVTYQLAVEEPNGH